jgi:hypothetical protein
MFLTVFDDISGFNDYISDDMPDVIRETLMAFDHFTYHLRFTGENVDYAFRADLEIKDYE